MLASVRENGYFVLACGLVLVLAAVAYMIVRRGGKVRVKVGPAEMEITAPEVVRKLDEMHATLEKVNEAVNHQGPGEDTLITKVALTQTMLQNHVDLTTEQFTAIGEQFEAVNTGLADLKIAVNARRDSAVAWQEALTKALPDHEFPPLG